ncbi:MAG: hypothetical protein HIU82_01095 [Proteobacteria bacterium]|nr:hypothetical protein [Pseudomonadota bacterium]
MDADWNALSDETQLAVTREALHRAADTIASQAEDLASEIDAGRLADRGGPDALRLFAALVRSRTRERLVPAGHC